MSPWDVVASVGKFLVIWSMTAVWSVAVVLFISDWIQVDRTNWMPHEKRKLSIFFGLWGLVVAVLQMAWWRT